jgi:acyl-ACP thioesterase
MDKKYIEKINVRNIDYDSHDFLKPYLYLDYFEDAASNHSYSLGLSYKYLLENDLCWVVLKNKIEILRRPKYLEPIYIETWPRKKDRVAYDRNYIIKNDEGEILVKGASRWVLCSISKRQISRYNYDFKLNYDILDNGVLLSKFKTNDLDFKYIGKYQILRSDIDHNKHMNNIKYVEIMYNFLDNDILEKMTDYEIDYIKECYENDIIDLHLSYKDKYYYLLGKNNDNISFQIKIGGKFDE